VDTVVEFLLYFLYGIGGLVCWLAKGCRSSLSDEMSDKHAVRNGSIAVCLFGALVALVIYLTNRP